MFRSHLVSKISIFGLISDRAKILSKLHKLGVLQIQDVKAKDLNIDLNKPDTTETLAGLSDNLLRVSRINNILNLAPKKLRFVQNIFGLETLEKVPIKFKNQTDLLSTAKKFLDKNEENALYLEEKYNEFSEKQEHLSHLKKIIAILERLGIPVNYLKDGDKVTIISGRMPTANIKRFKKNLAEETEEYSEVFAKQETKVDSIVTAVALRQFSNRVNFLAKKYGMQVFTLPNLPKVDNIMEWIDKEIKNNHDLKKKIVEEIKALQEKHILTTISLREELELYKQKNEALHLALDSESFFVIQGWILNKDIDNLRSNLEKTTSNKITVIADQPDEKDKDDIPVELSNPWYLKPFEMLTELYALPKYRDLDPTFIVGPLFLIYAAFMLTDAVYGLGLVILGIILLWKFSKYDVGLKYITILILGMGSLTVFFGILTGSYFGDLPKYLFGIEASQLAIWGDPLSDPLYFLVVAIAVAVVHLNIGFLLGSLEDIRKKDYKTLWSERLVWIILELAVALFAIKSFLGINTNPHLFTVFGTNIGLAAIIGILSTIFILKAHGLLGLLGATGLMGDMISYSRLFALSLSTAGIALAVNLLADLVSGVPYIGFILMILIFMIGHTFGFVMNTIGSFVHSLRLQFVEFFGRFYEGGGDKFTPFKEERTYTEVEE